MQKQSHLTTCYSALSLQVQSKQQHSHTPHPAERLVHFLHSSWSAFSIACSIANQESPRACFWLQHIPLAQGRGGQAPPNLLYLLLCSQLSSPRLSHHLLKYMGATTMHSSQLSDSIQPPRCQPSSPACLSELQNTDRHGCTQRFTFEHAYLHPITIKARLDHVSQPQNPKEKTKKSQENPWTRVCTPSYNGKGCHCSTILKSRARFCLESLPFCCIWPKCHFLTFNN